MKARFDLLCDAGLIDRDICTGMLRVVKQLEDEWQLPVNSEQGIMAMTHMANALMRSRRGIVIDAMDSELLNEMKQSCHWPQVVQIHKALMTEFDVRLHSNEEGFLLANLFGLWMVANDS